MKRRQRNIFRYKMLSYSEVIIPYFIIYTCAAEVSTYFVIYKIYKMLTKFLLTQ